jgi:hypothetical protein
LQLDVPDAVVRKRLANSTIADYHREMDFLKVYYPNVRSTGIRNARR